MLNKIITRITQNLNIQKRMLRENFFKNIEKNFRDIQTIRLLVFILLIVIIITLLIDGITSVTRDTSTENQSPANPVNWEITIPDNYSIRDKGSYINNYYGVFYEAWSGNYGVIIYEGEQYQLSQIESYINNQLLSFKDFEDYSYFETHEVNFTDKRHENLPTMDIPAEAND